MTPAPKVPLLLVSVRDAREARCALMGGADIIDFKDPERGSLGRADADTMAAAIREISRQDAAADPRFDLLLSAAMGEAVETAQFPPQRLPGGLSYLKLGLSGMRHSSDWVADWLGVRSLMERQVSSSIQWVAVAYADADVADAPPVEEVVDAAGETGCAGVLIDTFGKANGRLLDHLDMPSLIRLAQRVRREQMFFALAGRLRIADLPTLRLIAPDVVAVRSAACENGDRQAHVTAANVRRVRDALIATYDVASPDACTTRADENGRRAK